MADLPDMIRQLIAVFVGEANDIDADELHATQEPGGIGLLLLHEPGGEGEQVAVHLDFHEFTAVAGHGEFAKIHLAGRRIGKNVQTDTGGEDGDCERMRDQVFHNVLSRWFLGNLMFPSWGIPGSLQQSFRKIADQLFDPPPMSHRLTVAILGALPSRWRECFIPKYAGETPALPGQREGQG